MTNVALNKPSKQSSALPSATDPTRQNLAHANNGDTDCEYGLHTELERDPWWQVDLGADYMIDRIELFNRYHYAERLIFFTILLSTDGNDWMECFRKRDATVFGALDKAPLVLCFTGRDLARYVRLRLDGLDYLHVREVQIFGRRPDADLHATLTAEAEAARRLRSAVPPGRTGKLIYVDGFSVFADQENYDPEIIQCLEDGTYERSERALVKLFIKPGDRILEIGSAAGLVSMTAASIAGVANVLTFDANPDIIADAKANYLRNGLAGIQARHGILRNRCNQASAMTEVDFYIAKAFWASRMNATLDSPDIVRKISVPVFCLEDEIERHRANVLICDIEGGEIELLSNADLKNISLIILETHYLQAGEAETDAMIAKLIHSGLNIHLGRSSGEVVVLRRHCSIA